MTGFLTHKNHWEVGAALSPSVCGNFLVGSGLLCQNTINCMVYKQQRLTSLRSGGWKLETRCQQSPCLVRAGFLGHKQQEGPGSSLGLFDEGSDLIPEAPPS